MKALAAMIVLPIVAGAQTPASFIPRLEKNLQENILRFWYPSTLDREHGGYVINHDAQGRANPKGTKGIVTQSRQVWLFSRAAREGYRTREMNEAAAHGFRFLRDRMWDPRNGGFFWEVDAAGKPLKPKKHMYGQSFGLYALSEYYLATKDKEALALANRLFLIFEQKAYDREYGGYREWFNEDWTLAPPGEAGYMQVTSDIKLMNTHLHLMEAMTAYYRASKSPVALQRLIELINIEASAVVRKNLVACTDKYDRNWTPRLDHGWDRVSYGHDLENVWLLIDACRAAGVSTWPFMDLYRGLWDYSLRYGYDSANGGFFYTGAFNSGADDKQKSWWVQAEALVSALYMYRLTGERRYWEVFAKTYDFVDKFQTDWQVGEWHANVTPEGKGTGAKAQIWKAGYHNGRAMMECLRLLRDMERGGEQGTSAPLTRSDSR